MGKVEFKFDTRRLTSRVIKTFGQVKKNKKMLREIGDFLVFRIASEGKRGRPFNNERSFPRLEESTIKNRRYLSRYNRTSRVFSAGRSNTSLTGQLWDSLDFFLKGNGIVEVKFTKRRTPYRSGTGRYQKQNRVNSRNASLAEQLAQGVRSKRGVKKYVAFQEQVIDKDVRINKRINVIVAKFLRRALSVEFRLR